MANANKPMGLSPVGTLNGANWNEKCRVYCIPATDPNAIAVGDPVILAGSADSNGVPTITLATAGTAAFVLGAVVSPAGSTIYGGSYGVPADSPVVIPATKTRAYYVLVADDPSIIFEVQEDGLVTPLAAADVGLNCNLVAGTNNGFLSGWMLDSDSKNSGATRQMKLLRLAQSPAGVNVFGALAKWWVTINTHALAPNTAGF